MPGAGRKLCGAAAVVVMAGCQAFITSPDAGSSSPAAAPVPLPAGQCLRARDCGGGFDCVLPDGGSVGACVKVTCESDAECAAGSRCHLAAMVCVPMVCNPLTAEDCAAGQVCTVSTAGDTYVGACMDEYPRPAAGSCAFDRAAWVTTPGGTRPLHIYGVHDAHIIPFSRFQTQSTDPSVVSVDGNSAVALQPGSAHIQALAPDGTVTCEQPVHVLQPLQPEQVRAVVLDGRTGEPLEGATVQLRLVDGTRLLARGDANGVTVFSGVGGVDNLLDVTAFSTSSAHWDLGHHPVTYVRPPVMDLAFRLNRVPRSGAMTVSPYAIKQARPRGDIKLGLAGLAQPSPLESLSLAALEGLPRLHDVIIPSLSLNARGVPMGSQLDLYLGSEHLAGPALAQAPVDCDGPLCLQVAWGLATATTLARSSRLLGDLSLVRQPGDQVWDMIPEWRTGSHAVDWGPNLVETDAQFNPRSTVGPVPWLTAAVTVADNTVWHIPTLPLQGTQVLDQVLLVSGVWLAGVGFVPLGLDAAMDACTEQFGFLCRRSPTADRVVSCAARAGSPLSPCDDLPSAAMRLFSAPAHDGLEVFAPVTVAVASSPRHENLAMRPLSMLLARKAPQADVNGVVNAFPEDEFLELPDGVYLHALRTAVIHHAAPDADYHAITTTGGERSWTLVLPPTAGPQDVELPPVAPGMADLTVTGVAFKSVKLLRPAGALRGISDVVSLTGIGLDEEALHASAVAQSR